MTALVLEKNTIPSSERNIFSAVKDIPRTANLYHSGTLEHYLAAKEDYKNVVRFIYNGDPERGIVGLSNLKPEDGFIGGASLAFSEMEGMEGRGTPQIILNEQKILDQAREAYEEKNKGKDHVGHCLVTRDLGDYSLLDASYVTPESTLERIASSFRGTSEL